MNEAKDKKVVFTFGRFQPPTSGHQLLIEKVQQVAKKLGAEHRIYPSPSHDVKQNPLSHSDKVKYMKKMFKGANIMNDKKMINPFKVAEQLSEQGYTHVTMVVGSDRVQEFKKGIGKYVGTDGYNFKFNVVSAGKRDPDAEGVVGMSGSKMRQAVKDGDLASFSTGVPSGVNKKDIQGLFKAIKKGMGLKEQRILTFGEYEEYALFEKNRKSVELDERRKDVYAIVDKKGKVVAANLTDDNSQKESSNRGGQRKGFTIVLDPDAKVGDVLKTFARKESVELDEVSREARIKMSRSAKRTAKKRAKTRQRKQKLKKTGTTLVTKSQKDARSFFKSKFLRGKSWSSLGNAEKQTIEKRLKKIKPAKLKSIAKKLLPGIRKSERERIASLKDLGNKPDGVDEAKARDYRKEYDEYHSRPEQRANRSKRVLARRKLEKEGRVSKGDGKDVDHKDGNAQNNSDSNLRVMDRHLNRSRNNNKGK